MVILDVDDEGCQCDSTEKAPRLDDSPAGWSPPDGGVRWTSPQSLTANNTKQPTLVSFLRFVLKRLKLTYLYKFYYLANASQIIQ